MKTALLATLCLLGTLSAAYGHPCCEDHFRDFKTVFDGYGDKNARELFREISTGTDTFHKKIGLKLGPDEHRLIGHGWPLFGRIPKDVRKEVDSLSPGKSKELVRDWRKFAKDRMKTTKELTGLSKGKAKAFAELLHGIHLLGDLEPDNTVIKHVLPPQEIAKTISKNVKKLFNGKPDLALEIERNLESTLKWSQPLNPQQQAQRILDTLAEQKLGEKLHAINGDSLKIRYSSMRASDAADMTNRRLAERPIPEAARPTPKAPSNKWTNTCKPGMKNGMPVLGIEGGWASYQFAKGDIRWGQYRERMGKILLKSAIVGLTISINPFGTTILSGITSYWAADTIIDTTSPKPLRQQELEAYGVHTGVTALSNRSSALSPRQNPGFQPARYRTLRQSGTIARPRY